jgi:hypothetical protein
MTLTAWIITMRGRIREALVPELQELRDRATNAEQNAQGWAEWARGAMARTSRAEADAAKLRRQVDGLKRHLARYEKAAMAKSDGRGAK